MSTTSTDLQTYSPPQVADLLGVYHQKVLSWINSGELRAINMTENSKGKNPRYRILKTDLERFLEMRATRKAPKPVRTKTRRAPKDYFA